MPRLFSEPQTTKPALTLLLGPAGAGKTARCLERFSAANGRALFVASPGLASIQQRALDMGISASYIEEPTAFFESSGLVLALTKREQTEGKYLSRIGQQFVLEEIFAQEIPTTDYFGRMHGVPGFAGSLTDCIRELKLFGITPEELSAGSVPTSQRLEDPDFGRKAEEIGRLFSAYERFLKEEGRFDTEDRISQAIVRLEQGAELPRDAEKVYVDGFYPFVPLWRRFLAAMVHRGAQVTVTLIFDPARPLLFASSQRTRELLHSEFLVAEEMLLPSSSDTKPIALWHVERELFSSAGKVREGVGTTETQDPPITIFDAPNPYAEVEMIARELWREHHERGTPWKECVVVQRSVGGYTSLIKGVFEKYRIPYTLKEPQVVAENPLLKTVLTLCDVFLKGWQREDVIAFLKSSYIEGSKVQADRLRIQAKRMGLREGRDRWQRITVELKAQGGAAQTVAEQLEKMFSIESALLPLQHTPVDFMVQMGLLYKDFGLHEPHERADRSAFAQADRVLTDIFMSAPAIRERMMEFAEFHRRMLSGWQSATYPFPAEENAVSIVEPEEAASLHPRFVTVLGLTERIFPRRIVEDPFFRDEERVALQEVAGLALQEQKEHADDERLLFYMATAAPRERLVLTFPRSADESDTLPSFYLDEVRALFDHVPTEIRTLADVAPRPDECVSDHDRLLAACTQLEDGNTIQNPKSKI